MSQLLGLPNASDRFCLLLSRRSYSAFPMPLTSDLRGSKINIYPVPTSSGLFVHFASDCL